MEPETDDPKSKLSVRVVGVDSHPGVEKITIRPLVDDTPVGPAVVLTIDQAKGLGIVEAGKQYLWSSTGQ